MHVKCNRIKFQEVIELFPNSPSMYSNNSNNAKRRNLKQQHKKNDLVDLMRGGEESEKKKRKKEKKRSNLLHRDSTNGSNYSVRERKESECLSTGEI